MLSVAECLVDKLRGTIELFIKEKSSKNANVNTGRSEKTQNRYCVDLYQQSVHSSETHE